MCVILQSYVGVSTVSKTRSKTSCNKLNIGIYYLLTTRRRNLLLPTCISSPVPSRPSILFAANNQPEGQLSDFPFLFRFFRYYSEYRSIVLPRTDFLCHCVGRKPKRKFIACFFSTNQELHNYNEKYFIGRGDIDCSGEFQCTPPLPGPPPPFKNACLRTFCVQRGPKIPTSSRKLRTIGPPRSAGRATFVAAPPPRHDFGQK